MCRPVLSCPVHAFAQTNISHHTCLSEKPSCPVLSKPSPKPNISYHTCLFEHAIAASVHSPCLNVEQHTINTAQKRQRFTCTPCTCKRPVHTTNHKSGSRAVMRSRLSALASARAPRCTSCCLSRSIGAWSSPGYMLRALGDAVSRATACSGKSNSIGPALLDFDCPGTSDCRALWLPWAPRLRDE